MELQIAQKIASKILTDISSSCSRSAIAGSVRRKKKDVKDIEIVAIVDNYNVLYEALRHHGRIIKPGTPEIIDWPAKQNAKYIRMLLNDDIKLDFFVAHPDNWGGLYAMRTGSAVSPNGEYGFIPAVFANWKRKSGGGRMMSCMPTTPEGVCHSVPEEEDFFDLCGIKWIDPEYRSSAKDAKRVT
jgi:DNA polymerase/3'-5' exonuclease PolX